MAKCAANLSMMVTERSAAGGASWDHSAMIRALEKLANHQVGA